MPVQAQTVQSLKLVTNHIVADPVSGMIYASVPSSAGTHGNSIATIDPSAGAVVRRVFVGSEPNVLAASDDGQFLYVGLDGAEAVRRYVIATHRAGLQFSLGGYNAQDLKVLPGAPHSVAVLANNTVAIFDNGVQRPNVASGSFESLAFSNSASVLYAQDEPGSFATFSTLAVDPQGVSVSASVNGLLGGSGPIVFDPNTGLIYSTSGSAADPDT